MGAEFYRERGRFSVDARLKRGLEDQPFQEVPPPPEAVVFLRQHLGPAGRPLVREGQRVRAGEKIGDGEDPLSVPVHSPVTGTVVGIRSFLHPMSGREEPALLIRTEDEAGPTPGEEVDPQSLPREDIVARLREAGLVGLGGAGYPTHAKLRSARSVRYLVINAKESDVNVACDVRLLKERPKEVVAGIEVLARALGNPQVLVATRTEPGELPEFEALLSFRGYQLVHVHPSYSLGSERLLIPEVLGISVPLGRYPVDVGVVVHNVMTAHAAGQAVRHGIPLVSRGLTFWSQASGGRNLWVRVGTPVSHILHHLGLDEIRFDRFVFGSALMGWAVTDPATPMVKTTTGILGLTPQDPQPYRDSLPCIRCGYCDSVCPVRIYPSLILAASRNGDVAALRRLKLEACIECGLCSYVCPARILFTPALRAGKRALRNNSPAL
ncbi:MAG: RnfABCDGE type electron transport complex subunit C [Candidatus Bipolaricaulaceae bacterium]